MPTEAIEAQHKPAPEPRSGAILVLAYGLGPFAPTVLRQGSHNLPWTMVTLLVLLAWSGMAWRWSAVRDAVATGTVALVPWMLGLAVASGVWVLAMARALWLAGSDPRFVIQKLPRWVRRPHVCMLLGFALPGFGHLVSGHPRRAAVAAMTATSTVLPWLLLWQAEWIWQCNRRAGSAAVPGLALEVVFLAAAALAVCGVLAWIASGLDGARLQAQRLGQHAGLHGDRVALALLVTWILALLNLHPEKLAKDLDRLTSALQAREYRLVPLCLEWTAMRLDRAEPRYPMVSANLLDALGKHEAAQSLRRDLRQRWESYAEHLLREEVRIGGVLYPPLISVTEESEVLPPWLGTLEITAPVAKDSTQATATTDSTATPSSPAAGSVVPSAPSSGSLAPQAPSSGRVVPNAPSGRDSMRSENTAPSTPPASRDSL